MLRIIYTYYPINKLILVEKRKNPRERIARAFVNDLTRSLKGGRQFHKD